MAQETKTAYEGLANLANSVRRSTALYVAMSITPAEGTVDDLLATADRLAEWLLGSAAVQAERRPAPLGRSLDEVNRGTT